MIIFILSENQHFENLLGTIEAPTWYPWGLSSEP
jgi:hypothetical protein